MRWRILALFLLLLAIPPLLGVRPAFLVATVDPKATAPILVQLVTDPAAPVLEFLRIVVGAFIGAGAAFVANLELQRHKQRTDEIAAGNAALSTLILQYNGFMQVRQTVIDEIAFHEREQPGVPLWFTFRPSIHFRQMKLEFDFKSLTFLFEEANVEWFKQLHQTDMLFREVFGHLERLSENAIKRQEKMEEAGIVTDGEMSPAQAMAIVGPRLQMELQLGIDTLRMHNDRDGPVFLAAGAELYRLLSQRFGPGVRLVRLIG